jgi:hypothetical protein
MVLNWTQAQVRIQIHQCWATLNAKNGSEGVGNLSSSLNSKREKKNPSFETALAKLLDTLEV